MRYINCTVYRTRETDTSEHVIQVVCCVAADRTIWGRLHTPHRSVSRTRRSGQRNIECPGCWTLEAYLLDFALHQDFKVSLASRLRVCVLSILAMLIVMLPYPGSTGYLVQTPAVTAYAIGICSIDTKNTEYAPIFALSALEGSETLKCQQCATQKILRMPQVSAATPANTCGANRGFRKNGQIPWRIHMTDFRRTINNCSDTSCQIVTKSQQTAQVDAQKERHRLARGQWEFFSSAVQSEILTVNCTVWPRQTIIASNQIDI